MLKSSKALITVRCGTRRSCRSSAICGAWCGSATPTASRALSDGKCLRAATEAMVTNQEDGRGPQADARPPARLGTCLASSGANALDAAPLERPLPPATHSCWPPGRRPRSKTPNGLLQPRRPDLDLAARGRGGPFQSARAAALRVFRGLTAILRFRQVVTAQLASGDLPALGTSGAPRKRVCLRRERRHVAFTGSTHAGKSTTAYGSGRRPGMATASATTRWRSRSRSAGEAPQARPSRCYPLPQRGAAPAGQRRLLRSHRPGAGNAGLARSSPLQLKTVYVLDGDERRPAAGRVHATAGGRGAAAPAAAGLRPLVRDTEIQSAADEGLRWRWRPASRCYRLRYRRAFDVPEALFASIEGHLATEATGGLPAFARKSSLASRRLRTSLLALRVLGWALVLPVLKHVVPGEVACRGDAPPRRGLTPRDLAREERIVTFARWGAGSCAGGAAATASSAASSPIAISCRAGAKPTLVVGSGRKDERRHRRPRVGAR